MHRLCLFLLVVTLFTFGAPLRADIAYTAALDGANEVPPTGSAAAGFAVLTVSGDSLNVNVTFTDLVVVATAAHIHCCTPPGTNTQVALPFIGFPNTTSGTYDKTYDLTDAATYSGSFLTVSGGTAAGAEAGLIAGLNAGQAYVNIHDAIFPGGEIRGFATLAPEPGYLGLLGLGLVGMAVLRRCK